MLPNKTGLVVSHLDEARHAVKQAQAPLMVLSRTRIGASSTALRPHHKQAYICDTSILSPQRLERLTGAARHVENPRFGLIVSNGYGLGHVTRMRAIGEGLKQFGPVAFMSFSAGLVDGAFYLPSPQYLNLSNENGRVYVREAALRFFNAFAPTHILYDGNVLPPGLLAALALRPDIHLTWIRRGQWQANVAPDYMAQQAQADLVIEPGDLSDTYDMGPTWTQRLEYCPPRAFLKTKPIRPFNPKMLDRDRALKALCLPQDRKYVLLMPGASQKAEDQSVIQQCVSEIIKSGAVPVIAHWPMSHDTPPVIDGAVTIEIMPIAPYYRAFDAIVSAAGYNSFHELIELGIPTIFIPQEDTGRDQQLARAQYAVDHGLAAMCRRSGLHFLSELLTHLEQSPPRAIDWHDDWRGMAQAMGIAKTGEGGIRNYPRGIAKYKRFLKTIHRDWLMRNAYTRNIFVLALDCETERFLKKRIDTAAIIVTNSVDPVALRRSGYKYLWLNSGVLTDYALKRQFLNWLSLYRPARIKSI